MFQTSRNHEIHPCKNLIVRFFFFYNVKISKQMVNLLIIFRLRKIFFQTAGNDRSDTVNHTDFFLFGRANFVQVIIKIATDYFCIGQSDVADSKTVNYFCKCSLFCFLNAGYEVVERFLSKTVHRDDLIPVFPDFKNISEIMNKTFCNKFLQSSF